MMRSFELRLRPTKAQIAAFEHILADSCETYNADSCETYNAERVMRERAAGNTNAITDEEQRRKEQREQDARRIELVNCLPKPKGAAQ
jgi:hypothetical protein